MIPLCVRTVARFARTASLAVLALAFSASVLAAQATGKIEGRVRDNAGAPIANAQVFIVGTAFSALTNAQGYYFINNVPTGTVDMRAAFVGYRPVLVRGVLVRGGQTGTTDFALEASVVEVQAIEVTAERPLVPRDQVTSKPIVSGELADGLPADRINQVLALQPGVVASSSSNELSIRGGRSTENVTYVDGVPVQAGNRGGTFAQGAQGSMPAALTVATNGFQEATITTGASAAEFGNAQAGVISIETRTGGSRFRGNVGYETDGFMGTTRNNSLGFNRFQLGVSGPIAQNLTFSLNGALDGQKSQASGKDPEAFLYTPAGIDTVVAVPSPVTADNPLVDTSYVPITNFAVYRGNCDDITAGSLDATGHAADIGNNYGVDCQGARTPRSFRSSYQVGGKVNYTFGTGNRLSLSANRSQDQGRNFTHSQQLNPAQVTGFRNWNTVATGSGSFNLSRSAERALAVEAYLSVQQDRTIGGPLTSQGELDTRDPGMGFVVAQLDFRFNFDNFPINDELVSNYRNNVANSRRTPYDLGNTGQYNVVDQYRNNPYGILGWSESGGPTGRISLYSENRLVGRAAVDWQADRFNRVKFGGEFTRYDMSYYSHNTVDQFFSDVFRAKPNRYSGFASDRLDLGDVIVDLGLRYDWYKTGVSRTWVLDTLSTSATFGQYVFFPRHSSYGGGGAVALSGPLAGTPMQKEVADSAHGYLSPHLQVAFPVTQRTNIRLSYAHQVQAPDFGTLLTGMNTDLGITNTNHVFSSDLDFGKTITFEFGIRHEFNPDMVLDIAMYNKDKLSDAAARVVRLYDPQDQKVQNIKLFTSADFGNTRGIDVQLQRRIGNLFTGQVSYTFQDAKNTGSDPYSFINFGASVVDQLSATGNGIPPQSILPTANSRTHNLAGVGSFNFPDGWNQGTTVGKILQNVGVNATFRIASGTPYTTCANQSGNEGNTATDGNGGANCGNVRANQTSDLNAVRMPTFKTFDLRVTKGFSIRGLDLMAYADARNVLNLTNVLRVFQGTRSVRNGREQDLQWATDSINYREEATQSQAYGSDGSIDLRFGGAVDGGCGSWVTAANISSPVNCVYLIRAEERFGNGDHVFSLAEQERASTASYLVGRGLDNFYGSPRRVRLGLEVNF